MSVNTRSRKRAREDTESNASRVDEEIEKNRDFWFEDGNIVIIAQNTTAFCVHQSILSRHSEVFRDMFMIPQPAENKIERMEGRAMVALSDCPEDLTHILGALYDEGQKYFGPTNVLSFSAVSAMLRLGTKYRFEHIRAEAVRRLKICFPSSLPEFHDDISTVPTHQPTVPVRLSINCPIQLEAADAIPIINLAQTFDLDFLLPPAFYTCAQLDIHTLIHGVTNASGDIEKLSPNDLEKCLQGANELRQARLSTMEFLFHAEVSPNCRSPCILPIRRMMRAGYTRGLYSDCAALEDMSTWIEDARAAWGLCKDCAEYFIEIHEEQRDLVWNSLGKYFAVSQWPLLDS